MSSLAAVTVDPKTGFFFLACQRVQHLALSDFNFRNHFTFNLDFKV